MLQSLHNGEALRGVLANHTFNEAFGLRTESLVAGALLNELARGDSILEFVHSMANKVVVINGFGTY